MELEFDCLKQGERATNVLLDSERYRHVVAPGAGYEVGCKPMAGTMPPCRVHCAVDPHSQDPVLLHFQTLYNGGFVTKVEQLNN